MFFYAPTLCLPSSEELPDSDETPVDNELQDLIPSLLKTIPGLDLARLLGQNWQSRSGSEPNKPNRSYSSCSIA